MRIKLVDGVELNCEAVNGAPMMYQGFVRDSLTFVFDPNEVTISKIMEVFTSDNCKVVAIIDDNGEVNIHENYIIRTGLGISSRDQVIKGPNTVGVTVEDTTPMSWVTMAQTTYTEQTLQSQQEIIDAMMVSQLME